MTADVFTEVPEDVRHETASDAALILEEALRPDERAAWSEDSDDEWDRS